MTYVTATPDTDTPVYNTPTTKVTPCSVWRMEDIQPFTQVKNWHQDKGEDSFPEPLCGTGILTTTSGFIQR